MKFAWLSGPLALGAMLLSGAPAAAQDIMEIGRVAYERHCAGCHADPRQIGGRAARLGEGSRRTALERFLRRHHMPDADTRAAVVAWLAEVTR